MGYWLNKTFPNCSVATCISALNEASESITDKVNRAINHAFISNVQTCTLTSKSLSHRRENLIGKTCKLLFCYKRYKDLLSDYSSHWEQTFCK